MTDRTPRPAHVGDSAAERAAREEQHSVLIDLLGAYVDGELPPETMSQIDAHLVGCERCRRDLGMHQSVRKRLGVEPLVAAPPALRERVAAAISATPVEAHPAPAVRGDRRVVRGVGAGAAVVVLLVAGIWVATSSPRTGEPPRLSRLAASPTSVPLIRSVLADYRRVTAGDLPGRARDVEAVRAAVPFPVEPFAAPGVRLLAAWTTELEGEPAAVLAYRWEDRIVLQYLVAETRFFQHSGVRGAVSDGRLLSASDGAQGIVAWPTEVAGSLLVGDLSPGRLAELAAADLLVRRANRGAQ